MVLRLKEIVADDYRAAGAECSGQDTLQTTAYWVAQSLKCQTLGFS